MYRSEIEFLRKRDYKFIKKIGQGGLGMPTVYKMEIYSFNSPP